MRYAIDKSAYCDAATIEERRLPARSYLVPYPDRASADASERTFAVRLSLRPGFSPGEGERYPLLTRNVGTGEVSVLRELRMQVAFVPSIDFGW